jgi:hypothetical protein
MARWNTADPYAGGHRTPSFGPQSKIAVLVLTAAIPTLLLLGLVPAALFLPALGLLSLGAAHAFALVAWWLQEQRHTDRINLWDVAGGCAFVGFAAGILSQPEQVLELFGHASPTR